MPPADGARARPAAACLRRTSFVARNTINSVAVVDLLIAVGILILSIIAAADYETPSIYFMINGTGKDVLWYGLIVIPTAACVWLCGSICLIHIAQKETITIGIKSCYFVKSLILLIMEMCGFILPYLFFADYDWKINTILEVSNHLRTFNLLKIKPVTAILFAWQIISFFVVHLSLQRLISNLKEKRKGKTLEEQNILARLEAQRLNHLRTSGSEEFTVAMPGPSSAIASSKRVCLDMKTITVLASIRDESGNTLHVVEMNPLQLRAAEIRAQGAFQIIKSDYFRKGLLFEDKSFPPNSQTIGKKATDVKWKRPYEIVPHPKFFGDGVNRFDVIQSTKLGNCWFIAALASLTMSSRCFKQVVPEDNDWGKNDYCGICRFRFWNSEGNPGWVEVIVDDRLPTTDGKLRFMNSKYNDEFWGPLLEKAYAKFKGGYRNLDGGKMETAFRDLTGGRVEHHLLDKALPLDDLFTVINDPLKNQGMVACYFHSKATDEDSKEKEMEEGLLSNHAYSITDIRNFTLTNGTTVPLLRIRNPHGSKGHEWKGDWNKKHPLWDLVEIKTREELKLIYEKHDSEFWFPLKDFSSHFEHLVICYPE